MSLNTKITDDTALEICTYLDTQSLNQLSLVNKVNNRLVKDYFVTRGFSAPILTVHAADHQATINRLNFIDRKIKIITAGTGIVMVAYVALNICVIYPNAQNAIEGMVPSFLKDMQPGIFSIINTVASSVFTGFTSIKGLKFLNGKIYRQLTDALNKEKWKLYFHGGENLTDDVFRQTGEFHFFTRSFL